VRRTRTYQHSSSNKWSVWRQAEQTVVQYMASLVAQLGLSANPAALAHTLESELGIITMVELTAAAEQLPYVLDDSFPKEILDELIEVVRLFDDVCLMRVFDDVFDDGLSDRKAN
jgi:hypothetical protein